MKRSQKLLLIVLGAMLSACGQIQKRPVDGDERSYSAIGENGEIKGAGTMRLSDVGGDHFVIWSDDGQTFLPAALEDEFKVDGLRVNFEGRILKDAYTNHMSGTLITLDSIENVEQAITYSTQN